MKIARSDGSRRPKGWYFDLAHPALPFIGFANQGIHERHYHRQAHEVYLVARGSSTIVVDDVAFLLSAGDIAVVEPGEVHTFTSSSEDYFHFVLQCPPVEGDKVTV
jgi:mannose-6-phosphate isomerase-like protein (cupin superfamily)